MSARVQMRVTVVFEYTAHTANYASGIPRLMAEVDRDNFEMDTGALLEEIASNALKITVEPLSE